MIDIGAMKTILDRKGIYLAESLEELRAMVTAKFPGLSGGEVNEMIKKLKQQNLL